MHVIKVDHTRQLFLDDYLVDRHEGAQRIVHDWHKDPENPVFVKMYDWEGVGPLNINQVLFDPVDGLYKIWHGVWAGTPDYPNGYAESQDGLNWKRHPHVMTGLNNVFTVCVDPRKPKGQYRFYGMKFERRTADLPDRVVFRHSKNGLEWEQCPGNPWWEGPSDVLFVRWDSQRECFVLYHKLWRVTGTTKTGEPVKLYFASFIPTPDGDRLMNINGRTVVPDYQDINIDLLYEQNAADDGGGGFVSESFQMRRVIGRAQSDDFVNWRDHRVIVEPDNDDPLDVQSYGMPVCEYQGLYLGFLRYFEAISGRMDVQFLHSRDGINFHMPDKKLVLKRGDGNAWDRGMVITAHPIEINDQLCLYYGATEVDHHVTHDQYSAAAGRAWLRKDGFVSLTGGKMTTKPLRLSKPHLFVNASGKFNLSVRDLQGQKLASTTYQGDSIKEQLSLPQDALSNKDITLHVDLQDAHLYAIFTD